MIWKKNDVEESPDYLAMPKHAKGTRRFNQVPKYIFFVVMVFASAILVYGAFKRFSEPAERLREEEKPKKMENFAVPAIKKPEGPDVLLPPAPPPEIFTTPAPMAPPVPPGNQQIPEHIKQRIAAREAAIQSSPVVADFSRPDPPGQSPAASGSEKKTRVSPPDTDLNRQEEKNDFLDSFRETESPYLQQSRMAPISDTEIKAGSIIPGVMISGINSDLPGQIVGQVRQNVYDSATGRYLLIPAGAKIVGTYDSRISAGQERVLVAWNRIIFPDGSSISLEGMPGADQSGFAGFNDLVDNHYWRTFGNAALLSLFSAGIQLSQPRAAVSGTYNSQQIMAAAIGRQLGQLGMQLTQRNLNIQPTLEIRPGFQFSVMVTKDMVLPQWKGH